MSQEIEIPYDEIKSIFEDYNPNVFEVFDDTVLIGTGVTSVDLRITNLLL